MQITNRKWLVAKGQFVEQLKWALWFIIIGGVVIRGIMLVIADQLDDQLDEVVNTTLLQFMFGASNIFMLVIGTLSVYVFLSYFGQNGITRWEYYFGTLLSGIALTVTLTVSFILLNLIEILVVPLTPLSIEVGTLTLTNTAEFSLQYILTMFIYYLMGWFITIGFYRYNWLIGLVFVVIAIYGSMSTEALWDDERYVAFGLAFESSELPLATVITIAIAFIAIFAWINRRLTKNIVIKPIE